MARRRSRSLVSFLAVTAFGCAHAAELGELRVGSHIGQPLVADIELTAIEDQATPVQVRLASADVYRGANISMPPVLSSLTMSVMRRDGHQFLHITSLKPVESEHLHLYLDLADGNHRSVRLATVWLTPDPRPAPPAPEPARAAEPVPERALPPVPVAGVKPAAMSAVKPAPVPAAVVPTLPVRAVRTVAVLPKLLPRTPGPGAERPAACAVQPVPQATGVCIALDQKNAQLKSQIAGLEGKVKLLQVAMGAPTPVVAARPKPAAAAAAPRKPKPAPELEAGLPWTWIGAAVATVLALGGATLFGARWRSARNAKKAVPINPALMTGVKSRLMPR